MELHVITHEKQEVEELLSVWPRLLPWVDYFHIRFKNRSLDQVGKIAARILAETIIPPSSLVINSYIQVVEQLGCGGVHLPERQTDWKEWKHRLPHVRWGRSVHSLESARQAEEDGLDYIIAGHIFPSPSKPGQNPMGLDKLANMAKNVRIPVIAIGGIGVDQVEEVMRAGAAGIAVISAVSGHPSPERVVQELKRRGKHA
ncbi:thiazole tautomerase (transcriptional regulator TenI) [Lihuaxuella thermophila]|uniref:Thiazole tautomerase (Transcriptional regulator TenI) n=1 Tax=Lihuaxuella thermophila TaxID=1173111 RepID=A0A1H8DEZ7_9BACL|nr:thiazole tautomerase (transcriptional regulator TenI) [Lihuaxuella thermophila]